MSFSIEDAVVRAEEELSGRINSLPAIMSVNDVADFMKISLTTAYKIAKEDSFPPVKIDGSRRIVVAKAKFIRWLLGESEVQT